MKTPYADSAILDALLAGWTTKVQHIDNNPENPLLGVRLTNARALFERAVSIQIFDRSTVALQSGFTNDETITLDREDGHLFLEWLRDSWSREQLNGIPQIDWAAIPEKSGESRPEVTAALDLAKLRLVDYLVKSHPERFGRFAVNANGEFFDAVRELIEDPAGDTRARLSLIQSLTSLAHDAYKGANLMLREHSATGNETNYIEARGLIRLAELLRERIGQIAEAPDELPAANAWPDAINVNGQRQPIEDKTGITHFGAAITVIDPKAPHFQQMGIVDRYGQGGFTCTFAGQKEAYIYTADQLKVLG